MNEWMNTPLGKLELAIINYKLEIVRELLAQHSYDLNQLGPGSQCALVWSIESEISRAESEKPLSEPRDALITEMLLKRGAEPNTKDDQGYTPLDYATGFVAGAEKEPRHPVAVKLLRQWGGKRRQEL